MKIRAIPALEDAVDRIASGHRPPRAVLIDALTLAIFHVHAAAETFGPGYPTLVVSTDCSDDTARARFVARGSREPLCLEIRATDQKFRRENPKAVSHYQEMGCLVETDTECNAEAAYQKLLKAFHSSLLWESVSQPIHKVKEEYGYAGVESRWFVMCIIIQRV